MQGYQYHKKKSWVLIADNGLFILAEKFCSWNRGLKHHDFSS